MADNTEEQRGSGNGSAAPARPPIFRETALERFASPEQLDRLISVTSPRAWIGVASIWVLLAALIAWSLLGTIPIRVHGTGMLLEHGAHIYPVATASVGRVTDIAVAKGDEVEQGQTVAQLAPTGDDRRRGGVVKLESPVKGRVTEILISVGAVVAAGDRLLTVASEGEGIDAVIYLPPRQFGEVTPGMAAQVMPDIVDRNEYGSIRGTVEAVDAFPSSEAEIVAALQNKTLAAALIADGPPTGIRIDLMTRPGGSGFQWSTSDGPPFEISGGALANATVIVREVPPIVLVIPAFKRLFGL